MQSIYMAARADGSGYRRVSPSEVRKLDVYLEGVDGDEENDTVTYWYARTPKEER